MHNIGFANNNSYTSAQASTKAHAPLNLSKDSSKCKLATCMFLF